jgi:hypothetical protein
MAAVRPNRNPTVLAPIARSAFAFLIAGALLAGCSEKASRITGNERLKRGSGSLGTTSPSDTLLDRDTAVPPVGTTIRGATLLVGQQGGVYEARSLFRERTWTLPGTSVVIDSVLFRIEFDDDVDNYLPLGGSPYSLSTAGAPWDTTTVDWPGPALGTFLASGPDGLGPFTIDLGASTISLVRAWAADTSFAGLVLHHGGAEGVRGFKAGTGRIEIVYHAGVTDSTMLRSVTPLRTDLTVHTPFPPATGTEAAIPLGGLFRAEPVLRGPVGQPPPGFSINGAQIVAYIDPSVPVFPTDEKAEIRVYRVRQAWAENVAEPDTVLHPDVAALATISDYRVRSVGDSLVIPIPPSLAREWSLNPASNQGVLLRMTDSFKFYEIRLLSRESARPPILRLQTTTPPPGRF